MKHMKRTSAIPVADLSGSAATSGHLEKRQVAVIMNLLPLGVLGRGPIRSTPIVCHTSSLTAIG